MALSGNFSRDYLYEKKEFRKEEFEKLSEAKGPTVNIMTLYNSNIDGMNEVTRGVANSFLVSGRKIREELMKCSEKIVICKLNIHTPRYPINDTMLNQNRATALVMIKAIINDWNISPAVFLLLPESIQSVIRPHQALCTTGVQFLASYFKAGRSNNSRDENARRFAEKLGDDGMATLWMCANAVDWVAFCRTQEKKGQPVCSWGVFCMDVAGREKGTAMAMLANLGAKDYETLGLTTRGALKIKNSMEATGSVGKTSGSGRAVVEINKTIAEIAD